MAMKMTNELRSTLEKAIGGNNNIVVKDGCTYFVATKIVVTKSSITIFAGDKPMFESLYPDSIDTARGDTITLSDIEMYVRFEID